MIRYINCVKRRPDISVEQFRQFWNSREFTDLINQVVETTGAKRFSKSATLIIEANTQIQQQRGSGEPFDGILEYWWDKASHLGELFAKPEAKDLVQKMLNYQKQFIDMPKTAAFFTEAE